MTDRQQEIKFAISIIQNICIKSNILLLPMKHKGVDCVGIHDVIENKDYYLIKNEG